MRILHAITGLQKAAGTSVFCGEICNQLVAQGNDVTVAVCNPVAEGAYELDNRVAKIAISELFVRKDIGLFDIVHVHGLWSPLLHKVSVWARRNKILVVLSPHGMLAPWSMKHKWWKKVLYWHFIQKHDILSADALHLTSELEGRQARELGISLPQNVVPLGTSLPNEKAAKVQRLQRQRIILFVGRIYPVKGLENLIRAYAQLKTDWKLRLVGPDQAGYMMELKQLCRELGVDASTEFTGPKFGLELSEEYDHAGVFVLPSFTENFGGVIVEAMAHSLPVITTKGTPWNELEELRCGWWIDLPPKKSLDDALTIATNMPRSELIAMGERGRQLVKARYTWPAIGRQMAEVYKKLIK